MVKTIRTWRAVFCAALALAFCSVSAHAGRDSGEPAAGGEALVDSDIVVTVPLSVYNLLPEVDLIQVVVNIYVRTTGDDITRGLCATGSVDMKVADTPDGTFTHGEQVIVKMNVFPTIIERFGEMPPEFSSYEVFLVVAKESDKEGEPPEYRQVIAESDARCGGNLCWHVAKSGTLNPAIISGYGGGREVSALTTGRLAIP